MRNKMMSILAKFRIEQNKWMNDENLEMEKGKIVSHKQQRTHAP